VAAAATAALDEAASEVRTESTIPGRIQQNRGRSGVVECGVPEQTDDLGDPLSTDPADERAQSFGPPRCRDNWL